jgi:hypothetical protein
VRGWDRNEVQVTAISAAVSNVSTWSRAAAHRGQGGLARGSHDDGEAEIDVSVPKRQQRRSLGRQRRRVLARGARHTAAQECQRRDHGRHRGDESEVRSVSGDVTVRGSGKPVRLRVSSVSGNLDLTNTAGTLDMVTVSGDASVHGRDQRRSRPHHVRHARSARKLTRDGRVDVEGVSGDIILRLSAPGGLSTEIESFSGDIKVAWRTTWSGSASTARQAAEHPHGRGGARVRAKTLSGDIDDLRSLTLQRGRT